MAQEQAEQWDRCDGRKQGHIEVLLHAHCCCAGDGYLEKSSVMPSAAIKGHNLFSRGDAHHSLFHLIQTKTVGFIFLVRTITSTKAIDYIYSFIFRGRQPETIFYRMPMRADPLSLHVKTSARQPRLSRLVGLTTLRPQEVIEPSTLGLELDATRDVHDGEVHPRRGVADGTNLVRDVGLGVLAHVIVEIVVGVEVIHVLGDGVVVVDITQVTTLAVLDLEGDTTRA
jgi:hypothetical protein